MTNRGKRWMIEFKAKPKWGISHAGRTECTHTGVSVPIYRRQ